MSAGLDSPAGEDASAALARAAAGLAGCPFRFHGRDPATGLDCVGLVGAALAAIGRPVPLPSGYRLRTADDPRIAALALAQGFVPAHGPPTAGELWLLRPGPGQAHLAIVGPDSGALIEAHAGLRRVVVTPLPRSGPLPQALLARWVLAV